MSSCRSHSPARPGNPSALLILVLPLALAGCAGTTRPDASPAPVEDRSIAQSSEPARTVSRASEVVPLRPPRAEPSQAPVPTSRVTPPPAAASVTAAPSRSARSGAPAPARNPARGTDLTLALSTDTGGAPRNTPGSTPASPSGTSSWSRPIVEARDPADASGRLLPGDPGYRHDPVEIGSAVRAKPREEQGIRTATGPRELPPVTLAPPPPIGAAQEPAAKPASVAPDASRAAATQPRPAPTRVAAIEAEPPLAATSGGGKPAVEALVAEADRQMRAGNDDAAAASLERALRVEPRDAFLWYRLAYVRLRQGRASDAESLALKSNSLAGDKLELVSTNWRLIARARRQLNDTAGAAEAESHIR